MKVGSCQPNHLSAPTSPCYVCPGGASAPSPSVVIVFGSASTTTVSSTPAAEAGWARHVDSHEAEFSSQQGRTVDEAGRGALGEGTDHAGAQEQQHEPQFELM